MIPYDRSYLTFLINFSKEGKEKTWRVNQWAEMNKWECLQQKGCVHSELFIEARY